MSQIFLLIKTGFLSLAITTMSIGLPLVTLVDGQAFAADTCVAPDLTNPGTRAPSGAAAASYHYDCGSSVWVNDHYTYNPLTQIYMAKDPVIYTYNAASGQYDYSTWEYSPVQSNYYQLAASVVQPPSGAQTLGAPAPVVAQPTSPTASPNVAGPGSTNSGGAGANGPTNANNSSLNANTTTAISNTTGVSLINNLYGQSTSGNAFVANNTTGGSATTGNAQDIANIVNMLQSSSNAFGANGPTTFVANINGDVNGDLLFDPANLSSIQNAGNVNLNNNTTVNNSLGASINNNVNLASSSGSASVNNNSAGGDATSGNATAIANLVNVLNSAITAGKSFIGVVNINGNLNGDILLPPNFIDQLVAANVPTVTISGPASVTSGTTTITDTSRVNNTNDLGINNNVTATAASGQAGIMNNTSGGSATTGNALTHITAFNLTGSKIVGSNDLLVFVNVLGQWVGLIVNAPAGSTAAELGGGITQNNTNITDTTVVNNSVKERINNNITVAAKSGDATVSNNTAAGSAKTGSAKTAVNLLNIENSTLAFSNWFGILFINVLGSWHGSFGINTSAGDPVSNLLSNSGVSGVAKSIVTPTQVFRFTPHASTTGRTYFGSSAMTTEPVGDSVIPSSVANATVLADSIQKTPVKSPASLQSAQNSMWKAGGIIAAVISLYIVADALLTNYRSKNRA